MCLKQNLLCRKRAAVGSYRARARNLPSSLTIYHYSDSLRCSRAPSCPPYKRCDRYEDQLRNICLCRANSQKPINLFCSVSTWYATPIFATVVRLKVLTNSGYSLHERKPMPSARYKLNQTSTGGPKRSARWRTSRSISLKTECLHRSSEHLAY